MSASAKNMEAIYKAKAAHDRDCPWGGEGKRVLMCPFDIARMGWEEGDLIAGLRLVSDMKITSGMLSVECDAEPDSSGPSLSEEVSKGIEVTPGVVVYA